MLKMAWCSFEIVIVDRYCMMQEDRHIDKCRLTLTSFPGTVDTSTFSQTTKVLVYQMTSQGIDATKLAWITARALAGDENVSWTFHFGDARNRVLFMLCLIVAIILAAIGPLSSAVWLPKPAKSRHILCDLDPSCERRFTFQCLGVRPIERIHNAGSFLKRVFRNRVVPVFIFLFAVWRRNSHTSGAPKQLNLANSQPFCTGCSDRGHKRPLCPTNPICERCGCRRTYYVLVI